MTSVSAPIQPGDSASLRDALAASEARYRALYENNPVMFFTLATDGTVLSVNRFGAHELGYQPRELVGRSVLDVFHPDDKEAVAAGLGAHLARPDPEGVSRWEFRKLRKNGEMIWVREAVTTTRAPDGSTVVLVVCDNITQWKQAERDLQVAKERLALTERMAALGTLVSGVAHEIRTPLTIIQTNAHVLAARTRQLVADEEDPASLLEPVRDICASVERVDRLVGDLRRFTTAARSHGRRRGSLYQPVSEATRLFEQTHGMSVRVEADLSPTQPVLADPVQVQQIVINLLQNAAEAIAEGGNREAPIRVTLHDDEDPAGGVILAVEDKGGGIPEEVQRRMLEPLFTTKPGGSGLGLAIVSRIAEEHRAKVRWTTSAVGTRFEVVFPNA